MTLREKLSLATEMAKRGERIDNIEKSTSLTKEQVKEIIKRVRG